MAVSRHIGVAVTARPREATALLRLGAGSDLLAPLARFAGIG